MSTDIVADPTEIPGLREPSRLLLSALDQQRMPQSLLLGGESGLGKRVLADALAARLLCARPSCGMLAACGRCESCHLRSLGNHPDLLLITPAEPGKPITIDQIRDANDFLRLLPQHAPRRVLLMVTADAMPTASANAFLKTLEEPGPHASIVLISDAPGRLLATIRSRCSLIRFTPPSSQDLIGWLQTQGKMDPGAATALARLCLGHPLRCLNWLRNDVSRLRHEWVDAWLKLPRQSPAMALALADRWGREKLLTELLSSIHTVLIDLMRLRLEPGSPIINSDFGETLNQLARHVSIHAMIEFEGRWRQVHLAKDRNLNLTLGLESLLLAWRDPAFWRGAAA